MSEVVVDTTAIARREPAANGPLALAQLTEADFNLRLTSLKNGLDRVRKIQRELMIEGEDYGTIPGTPKPTLLKPGSEKLCLAYTLVPTFTFERVEGDGEIRPHLRILARCDLHFGSADGPIVGEGVGAANSWEKRYRYRAAQRTCPSCSVEGSILRSSFEDRDTRDRGWYCNQKKGGCGTKFISTDPKIVEQQGGQVDNPDPYDIENTLYKMSAKRSQVDAALRATGTSGLFAQDEEDAPTPSGTNGGGNGNGHAPRPAQRASQTAAAPAPDALPAAPAAGNATASPSTGKIVEFVPKNNGWLLRLNTGYQCGVKADDASLISAVTALRDAGKVVELSTTKPSDPKYLPVLIELSAVAS